MLYRAQAVHQHRNGLPRDRFVNTFHVQGLGGADVQDAETIAEAIRDFYVAPVTGRTDNVCDLFSDVVAVAGHQVHVYPIDEATGVNLGGEGAPPMWTEVFDHLSRDTPSDQTGFPSEVAACISYKNLSAGSVPIRQRRGRIFFGPIAAEYGSEGANQVPTIPEGTRTFFLQAAMDLRDRLGLQAFQWSIYSRPYEGRGPIPRPGRSTLPAIPAREGSAYVIDQFSMDDAWDTQRRRGERATVRTTVSV